MNKGLFAELLESVREGGAILRGEKAPSRKFEIEAPDAVLTDSPVFPLDDCRRGDVEIVDYQ